MGIIMNDYFEIEQWTRPEDDAHLVKIRKACPDGTKRGVIVKVEELDLDIVPEGAVYRTVRLPKE